SCCCPAMDLRSKMAAGTSQTGSAGCAKRQDGSGSLAFSPMMTVPGQPPGGWDCLPWARRIVVTKALVEAYTLPLGGPDFWLQAELQDAMDRLIKSHFRDVLAMPRAPYPRVELSG